LYETTYNYVLRLSMDINSTILVEQPVPPGVRRQRRVHRSVTDRQTDRENKPLGFYGPIAPPVPNASSSECPQFRMPPSFDRSTTLRRRFNYNIPASVVLLQQCHCRNRHRGKLQNVSPLSVLFESSRIFFTIHRRHRRKKWWTKILKFEFCDFWEFFEIFKKVSCGPSAADLDHYGRGQTRSE